MARTGLSLADTLVGGGRGFGCGLREPGFEARVAEPGVFAGDERSFADFRAGVARARVSDDFAGIVEGGQAPADEFVQTKLFRAANFNDAIYRRGDGDPAYQTRDIVGSHRLEKHRRQMRLAGDEGNIGKPLEKFEELRGAND
jgi:hypothetical protein